MRRHLPCDLAYAVLNASGMCPQGATPVSRGATLSEAQTDPERFRSPDARAEGAQRTLTSAEGRRGALTPAEGRGAGAVGALLHQRLVELAPRPAVYGLPAVLAVVLQTGDVGAEEGGELAAASRALALVTHLVVQHVRLHLHPLVDVAVLQLHEARRDGSDVALLVAERHATRALGILELGVGVDTGVADAAIQPVHDHRQLHRFERPGHAAHKHGLAGVERQSGVQHEVSVAEPPGADLHRLVLDGGRRHAQVQLVVVLYARVYQLLHAAFVLEEQEGVALGGEVGLALRLMRPVHHQGPEPSEAGSDLLLVDVRRQAAHEHLAGEALARVGGLRAGGGAGGGGEGERGQVEEWFPQPPLLQQQPLLHAQEGGALPFTRVVLLPHHIGQGVL